MSCSRRCRWVRQKCSGHLSQPMLDIGNDGGYQRDPDSASQTSGGQEHPDSSSFPSRDRALPQPYGQESSKSGSACHWPPPEVAKVSRWGSRRGTYYGLLQGHLGPQRQLSCFMLRKDGELLYLVCTNPREQVLCPGREDYTASTSALRLSTNEEV